MMGDRLPGSVRCDTWKRAVVIYQVRAGDWSNLEPLTYRPPPILVIPELEPLKPVPGLRGGSSTPRAARATAVPVPARWRLKSLGSIHDDPRQLQRDDALTAGCCVFRSRIALLHPSDSRGWEDYHHQ